MGNASHSVMKRAWTGFTGAVGGPLPFKYLFRPICSLIAQA